MFSNFLIKDQQNTLELLHFFNDLFPSLTSEIVISLTLATHKEVEQKQSSSSSSSTNSSSGSGMSLQASNNRKLIWENFLYKRRGKSLGWIWMLFYSWSFVFMKRYRYRYQTLASCFKAFEMFIQRFLKLIKGLSI